MLKPTKCAGIAAPPAGRAPSASATSAAGAPASGSASPAGSAARPAGAQASRASVVSAAAPRVARRSLENVPADARRIDGNLLARRHSRQVADGPGELPLVAREADDRLVLVDHPEHG